MGLAAAYDFKVLFPMLCLGALGLAAACKFGDAGERASPPSSGPKLSALGG